MEFSEKQVKDIVDAVKKEISNENPMYNCVINVDLKQVFSE